MKRIVVLLLALLLTLTPLSACGREKAPVEDDTDMNTSINTEAPTVPVAETAEETTPETEPEDTRPRLDPTTLTAEKTYDNDHGSCLSTYPGMTEADFEAVCVYYEVNGWELYCRNDWNGNRFATYTMGDRLAHVYRIDSEGDLNIITSDTDGGTLPPKEDGVEGNEPTTITQLQQLSSQTSGLNYIVRLADGSFIVYDGGYTETIREFLPLLKEQSGSDNVHIRAWVLTHAHSDHVSCLENLSRLLKRYTDRYDLTLQVDRIILAPISNADALAMDTTAGQFYESVVQTCAEKLGAKLTYAHTGMTFDFANVTMEILLTGEELFIDGSTGYFNDTSMITRLRSNRPEETLSMIFLGDAGLDVANRLMQYYGDELKSDMCQISHHGVENFPLEAYEKIAASTLFYPCNLWLYALTSRDDNVRAALRESEVTQEILIRENALYTRYLDPAKNPAPIGKPDASGRFPTES